MAGKEAEWPSFPQDSVPTILVVEDEVGIRLPLCAFLRESGFKVVAAETAMGAIELIELGVDEIDLIFSDIRMPGTMDGLGLAQWVHENRPGTPVLLTTADDYLANAGRKLLTVRKVFPKPYKMHAVVADIYEAIGRQPRGIR
jgi:DNA-binding NtrC family response regulator